MLSTLLTTHPQPLDAFGRTQLQSLQRVLARSARLVLLLITRARHTGHKPTSGQSGLTASPSRQPVPSYRLAACRSAGGRSLSLNAQFAITLFLFGNTMASRHGNGASDLRLLLLYILLVALCPINRPGRPTARWMIPLPAAKDLPENGCPG